MVERCVVDTDVVSFLFKRDTRAELYRAALADNALAVSFQTVAELDRWAVERNWGQERRNRMDSYLERFVVVLPDRRLCRVWAEVGAGARRRGRPIQTADAWIAATALALGASLVTHNVDDYAGVDDLRLLPGSG